LVANAENTGCVDPPADNSSNADGNDKVDDKELVNEADQAVINE